MHLVDTALTILTCAAVGACGDNHLLNDGGPDCAGRQPATATHVATTALGPLFGNTVEINFPPSIAGDLVVFALSAGRPISPESTPLIATQPRDCSVFTTVWSVQHVAAGLSAATIANNETDPIFAYVVEFSGVPAGDGAGLAGYASGDFQTTGIADAPKVEACAGELVFSTITTCGAILDLAPDSTFVAAGTSDRFAAAFYVAHDNAPYGAAWSYEGTAWSGNTLVFR